MPRSVSLRVERRGNVGDDRKDHDKAKQHVVAAKLFLRAVDPEQMPQAVEELLRYDPPVERALTRYVAQDVVLGGQQLKRGDLVIVLLGSANRDGKIFPDAGRLDIDRETKAHIAFGKGVHYCLGAPLARLEAEIALNTLLRRMPGLRLALPLEDLEYRLVPLFHAYTHIPVRWDG